MYRTVTIHTRSSFWTHNETNEVYSVVDADDLAKEIEIQCGKLEEQGFLIVAINPITSGSITNGNGYIHTESVIITAHKKG